jgi:hypothetical protein
MPEKLLTALTSQGTRRIHPRTSLSENYQNHKGDLNFSKIVVCLDSLHGVLNFHFVILDEAVSVFLHFNSNS